MILRNFLLLNRIMTILIKINNRTTRWTFLTWIVTIIQNLLIIKTIIMKHLTLISNNKTKFNLHHKNKIKLPTIISSNNLLIYWMIYLTQTLTNSQLLPSKNRIKITIQIMHNLTIYLTYLAAEILITRLQLNKKLPFKKNKNKRRIHLNPSLCPMLCNFRLSRP